MYKTDFNNAFDRIRKLIFSYDCLFVVNNPHLTDNIKKLIEDNIKSKMVKAARELLAAADDEDEEDKEICEPIKLFFIDKTTPQPANRTKTKKTYKKKCKFCGKMFETTRSAKIYCSDECRTDCAIAERKKSEPVVRKKKKKTIDDYIAESEACGLSYGQYKAQLRLGKTFEELKAAYAARKKASD